MSSEANSIKVSTERLQEWFWRKTFGRAHSRTEAAERSRQSFIAEFWERADDDLIARIIPVPEKSMLTSPIARRSALIIGVIPRPFYWTTLPGAGQAPVMATIDNITWSFQRFDASAQAKDLLWVVSSVLSEAEIKHEFEPLRLVS